MSLSRRQFLARGSAFTIGFLGLRSALARRAFDDAGFGELKPDPAKILDLPDGFSYRVISRVGEEMTDGLLVPGHHDGMAAFPGPEGKTLLVRNHELEVGWFSSCAFGPKCERLSKLDAAAFYDFGKGKTPGLGGTTTVLYDTRTGSVEKHFLSLAGTVRNCAGGPTPWGSWLSCEEWTGSSGKESEKPHGFVFEVPAQADRLVPVGGPPLTAMGRFKHEAVAVDPVSGCVYQTEDLGDGLIYRFTPKERGRLVAGGRLQALMVRDQRSADLRNWKKRAIEPGRVMETAWVDLEDVLSPKDDLRLQGVAKGAAVFARNEGMWHGRDSVFFCSTNGGSKQKGQIWRYSPGAAEGTPDEDKQPGKLELFVESTDGRILENADNITVAPWGDLIVCEDEVEPGDKQQFLVGVTPEGRLYHFARNAMNFSEFAGATFSPDATTLFVNIQRPGLTLAISGPWRKA